MHLAEGAADARAGIIARDRGACMAAIFPDVPIPTASVAEKAHEDWACPECFQFAVNEGVRGWVRQRYAQRAGAASGLAAWSAGREWEAELCSF